MYAETDKMIRDIKTEDVLRCVRQSLRDGIGVFSPFWGVDSCFKLLSFKHIQPRFKLNYMRITR